MKTLSFKKVLLFTCIWVFYDIFLQYFNIFSQSFPNNFEKTLLTGVFLRLASAAPAFVFVLYYRKELLISISEMFSLKRINFKIIFVLTVSMAILESIYSLVSKKTIAINENFNLLESLITCFFIGLTEEIVYRGLAMNTFLKVTSLGKANILQSSFFSLTHLLPWISALMFFGFKFSDIPLSYLAVQLPYAFIIGYVFGYILNKTGSLWTTIIVHCLNDVIASALGLML